MIFFYWSKKKCPFLNYHDLFLLDKKKCPFLNYHDLFLLDKKKKKKKYPFLKLREVGGVG
jgi:hypothetical protein